MNKTAKITFLFFWASLLRPFNGSSCLPLNFKEDENGAGVPDGKSKEGLLVLDLSDCCGL